MEKQFIQIHRFDSRNSQLIKEEVFKNASLSNNPPNQCDQCKTARNSFESRKIDCSNVQRHLPFGVDTTSKLTIRPIAIDGCRMWSKSKHISLEFRWTGKSSCFARIFGFSLRSCAVFLAKCLNCKYSSSAIDKIDLDPVLIPLAGKWPTMFVVEIPQPNENDQNKPKISHYIGHNSHKITEAHSAIICIMTKYGFRIQYRRPSQRKNLLVYGNVKTELLSSVRVFLCERLMWSGKTKYIAVKAIKLNYKWNKEELALQRKC